MPLEGLLDIGSEDDIVRLRQMTSMQQLSPQLPLWSASEAANALTVRESPRARRLSVRVFRTGKVEVVVPRRTSQRLVARFLDQHRGWIERKRTEARRNAIPQEPFPPQRIELVAFGESWRVHLAGGSGRARVSTLAPGVLSASGSVDEPNAMKRALRQWLAAKAAELLPPLLQSAANELGVSYARVVIRRQRTRWGSCSTRGTISLNACLLFQRPQVVRYLLIHELAHTRHMNHSKRFWQCVGRWCTEYQTFDRELREGWKRVPEWAIER